jgi:hypothetical protein
MDHESSAAEYVFLSIFHTNGGISGHASENAAVLRTSILWTFLEESLLV